MVTETVYSATTGIQAINRFGPVTSIVPFSYRDGATMLTILYGLRDHINERVVPGFNTELTAMRETLIREGDKLISQYDNKTAEWLANFDSFMADVEKNIGILNENAVVGIVEKSVPIRNFLNSRYLQKGEFSVNVLDYGVVPDKTKDSTAGFQAALNAVRDAGGGTVFVPNPGPNQEYRLGGRPTIYANTTFKVEPGTVIRRWGGSFGLTNVPPNGGNPLTDLKDPYSGQGNIIIDGGIWEGYAPDAPFGNDGYGEGYNCFYFAVARNVTIRNVTVRNMATNHAIDVNGMNGMLIESSRFLGYHDTSAKQNRAYVEAIQYSPFFEDDPTHPFQSFTQYTNGLASLNMTIRDCEFGKSDRLPSWPTAFGNHSAQSMSRGALTGNIDISNCRFEGHSLVAIALWTYDNVTIDRNIFTDCNFGIKANNFGGGRRWNPNLRVWESAPWRQPVNNHTYSNNTFINTVDGDMAALGTGNAATDNSWATITNVKMINNTRVRTIEGRSKGPMIRALLCDDLIITGNTSVKSNVGFQLEACRNSVISGNSVDDTPAYGILVMPSGKPASEPDGYAQDVVVANNTVTNAGGHGIGVNDMVNVSITNNAIKNHARLKAGNGILSGTSDNVLISANRISCTSTPFDASGIAGFNSTNMVTTPDNLISGMNRFKVTAIVNETSIYGPIRYTD